MLLEIFSDKNTVRGFTLIEVLLVIGVTLLLASAAIVPVYGNLQSLAQVTEASAQITQTFRLAYGRAVAGVNDSKHGVYLDINAGGADSVTLYQGDSYVLRDVSYDRTIQLEETLTLSSTLGTDINFVKGTGAASATGTITFAHEITGGGIISINGFGVVREE